MKSWTLKRLFITCAGGLLVVASGPEHALASIGLLLLVKGLFLDSPPQS